VLQHVESGVVDGGAATHSSVAKELRGFDFSCKCGSLATTAKLLAASVTVLMVEDLGIMLSKNDLKDDLKMTTADAGCLLKALESRQQGRFTITPG
jgi:hypothetical protein